MTVETGTPRQGRETDPIRALAQKLANLERAVSRLSKTANLRNASISGGEGLAVKDAENNVRLRISTDEAAILAYDADGAEVARYGLLAHTDPGEYGLEVLSGAEWIHVGDETITWANLANKPTSFPPSGHTHPGGDITTPVSNAVTAASATVAGLADGSKYGFDNPVGGSTFYALWVGNDGGYHLGRNTSSIRYKVNVRPFTSAADLAALQPVIYDRKPTYPRPTVDGLLAEGPALPVPGAKGEFGLIAEEVAKVWPEVVTRFDAGDGTGPVIDGIRYDLIGPRLIPYVQGLQATVASLTAKQATQDKLIAELSRKITAMGG